MSEVILNMRQRAEAIQGLGYTGREAGFLAVAALHGGYFLRRQYCEFIGKEPGGTAANLIEKLFVRKHASVMVGCNNTKIFHLCSRPFYAAIGEEDNRNRRERPPFAIKNRLMGLDFVLAHPENTYLATEREKVEFFTRVMGIEQSTLPTKRFTSQKSKATTDRYFVDKYPIFIPQSQAANEAPEVSFCYVDEGVITGSRFGHYLRQYRSLFLALNAFRVVYVAAADRLFKISERDFRHFVAGMELTANGEGIDPQTKRMLEYFDARSLYESRHLDSFDRAKLLQLRNDREEFSGPSHEALYERWKTGDDAAILGNSDARHSHAAGIHGMFSTHLLKQDYDVFGTSPRASNEAEARGAGRRPLFNKVSGWSSARLSEES